MAHPTQAALDLALLGPPVVTRNGAPVAFDTRKAVALLAFLAVTGHEQSRERLAALLWPDSGTAKARSSLRRTLSVTVAAMGDGLAVTRSAVALRPDRVRVDVTEFERLAAAPGLAAAERATSIYRDDFLAGFAVRDCPEYDDWQMATADKFRQELAGALERIVAAYLADGEPARALVHARRWLALDPLHEPAHQAMIKVQAWTGQRSAALRQYRALVRILDRELAVRPLPETTRLYDDVRAGRLAPQENAIPREPSARREPAARPEPAAGREPAAGQPPAPDASPGWPLAGRDAELRALDAAWRAVAQAGQVVAVTGETGCGKTRLVEEFRGRAAAGGAVVLSGRCHDGESGLPFAVAADLLQWALSVCPDLADRLPAHVVAMAGRLAPELAAAHPDVPAPPLDSPVALTRLYGAIAETLCAAAAPPDGPGGPAGLVIVEDVHWADGPSLDLLGYLVRRLAGWPVLLLLSWAPEHAERLRGLRAALSEARGAARGQVVQPGPLTAADIAALPGLSGVPPAGLARLLAETRGLPMLVREYVEGLRAAADQDTLHPEHSPEGRGGTGDGEGWWPPASVRELLRRRVRAASEPTAQMLSTAAVLGSGCDADLLREVSGRGEAETVEALDEAVDRFLLTEIPPAGQRGVPSYEFPYEALRRVVYDAATLARRRLLHSRAADALTRRYERDPVTTRAAGIAEHLQRAGRDAEAAQWWWRAADRARELYAHAEAYAHLRKAEALGYPQVAASIALGDVLTVLGRYREALAEFEAAAAGSEADDASSAAIEHRLAEVHHRLGDWALADAHLGMALDLLAADDTGHRARIEADRAVIAYRRGAAEEAAGLAAAALTAARRAQDASAVTQALNVLGMLAARDGDAAAAEDCLRESLGQARSLRDPGAAVAALNNLARLLADAGQLSEALTLAKEALALGSELGDQHRVAALHTNLADLLHASGQREAAVGHLKEAARRFAAVDTGGAPRPEIWTLVEW